MTKTLNNIRDTNLDDFIAHRFSSEKDVVGISYQVCSADAIEVALSTWSSNTYQDYIDSGTVLGNKVLTLHSDGTISKGTMRWPDKEWQDFLEKENVLA